MSAIPYPKARHWAYLSLTLALIATGVSEYLPIEQNALPQQEVIAQPSPSPANRPTNDALSRKQRLDNLQQDFTRYALSIETLSAGESAGDSQLAITFKPLHEEEFLSAVSQLLSQLGQGSQLQTCSLKRNSTPGLIAHCKINWPALAISTQK